MLDINQQFEKRNVNFWRGQSASDFPWVLIIAAAGWVISGIVFLSLAPLQGSILSTSFVVALLFFLPGFMVLMLLRLDVGRSPWNVFVASFGIGAGIVIPVAFIVRSLRLPLVTAAEWIWLLEVALLIVLYIQWRSGRGDGYDFSGRGKRAWQADLILLVVLLPILLGYYITDGQNYARPGDWWVYLSHITVMAAHPDQDYQPHTSDAEELNERLEDNGWLAALTTITELVKVETDALDVFWRYLPITLLTLSIAGVYALASELFERSSVAVAASMSHLIVIFSTFVEDDKKLAGFTNLYRITQDKAMLAYVLVPIIALLVVCYLRRQRREYLLVILLVGLAAVLTHPLGIPWIAVIIGPYALLTLVAEPSRKNLITIGILAIVLSPLIAFPIIERGNQNSTKAAYTLADDEAYYRRDHLLDNTLLIFSREDNDFVAHPDLIRQPLIAAGILIGAALGLRARRDRGARYVFATTAALVFIMYAPKIPPLVGSLITPFLLWRFVWIFPIGLSLGWGMDALICGVNHRLKNHPRVVASLVVAALLLFAMWLLRVQQSIIQSVPYLQFSEDDLTEQEEHFAIVDSLSEYIHDREMVFIPPNPPELRSLIMALIPDVRTVYWRSKADETLYQQVRDFYFDSCLDSADVQLLRRFDVNYLVVNNTTDIRRSIHRQPGFEVVERFDDTRIYRVDIDQVTPNCDLDTE